MTYFLTRLQYIIITLCQPAENEDDYEYSTVSNVYFAELEIVSRKEENEEQAIEECSPTLQLKIENKLRRSKNGKRAGKQ